MIFRQSFEFDCYPKGAKGGRKTELEAWRELAEFLEAHAENAPSVIAVNMEFNRNSYIVAIIEDNSTEKPEENEPEEIPF